jgi:hypothetical protein
MSGANGRADPSTSSLANPEHLPINDAALNPPAVQHYSSEKVKVLIAELEVPFDPSVIEWRVTNTSKGEQRGQIVPYASPRAYTDRLNALVSPAGWTRKYTVHTSANFERAKDKKIVAKVLVTCELTIFGLGTHAATGEEWADSETACTSAEAQAFKRSAACLGLGRYLYYFTGVWVDLDERKRPKSIPRLFDWATPQGWLQGLRPGGHGATAFEGSPSSGDADRAHNTQARDANPDELNAIVRQIEPLAESLGKRLYRGILKSVARAWSPTEIHDTDVLCTVLAQMQSAERGLRRLEAALDRVGPETLVPILRSLRLNSLSQVDNLADLKTIVLAVEQAAGPTH